MISESEKMEKLHPLASLQDSDDDEEQRAIWAGILGLAAYAKAGNKQQMSYAREDFAREKKGNAPHASPVYAANKIWFNQVRIQFCRSWSLLKKVATSSSWAQTVSCE